MGTSMLQDSYEMRDFHRSLLQRNRLYLLHNIRPCETFWSSLLSKDVLSQSMIDEIKPKSIFSLLIATTAHQGTTFSALLSTDGMGFMGFSVYLLFISLVKDVCFVWCEACRTTNDQLGRLLDILPTRGPIAFEEFCIALLESDHPHVAEYLKTIEATDQFRRDIQPYCQDASEHLLDRYVAVFKRSTPSVMRFAERKYELILNETATDLKHKETEIRDLENRNASLEMEMSQLTTILKSCAEITDNIANEVQREFLSKSFLREEFKHLEKLKTTLLGTEGFEKIISLLGNIQTVLRCLERHTGVRLTDRNGTTSTYPLAAPTVRAAVGNTGAGGRPRSPASSDDAAGQRLQWLADTIAGFVDDIGSKQTVSGLVVRVEMEKMMRTVREVHSDVVRVRDAFRSTLKQKQKLEGEALSLLRCYQEIRRLEREIKEKVSHIGELTRQSQLMKKKVTTNPRQQRRAVDQIAEDIDRRRRQMAELEDDLRRQMDSADRRIDAMLNLLPDRDDQRPAAVTSRLGNHLTPRRSDTDVTASSTSRPVTPSGTTASQPTKHHEAVVPEQQQGHVDAGEETGEKGSARLAMVDGESHLTIVTGGRKLLERRRSKQQLSCGNSGNLNTKRVSVTRNGTRADQQRIGTTTTRNVTATHNSTDGGQSTGGVGHLGDTVDKPSSDVSKRVVGVAVRQREGEVKVLRPLASSTNKVTRRGCRNDRPDDDDDDDDSDDDEEEEDEEEEDSDTDVDSESRTGSPRKIQSDANRRYNKKIVVPNNRYQSKQQQQQPQISKKPTTGGVASEAGNDHTAKEHIAAEAAAAVVAKRDIGNNRTTASVSPPKQSATSLTSSPESGVAVGGADGEKRSPQIQQTVPGVANISALLAPSGSVDFVASKPKPVSMRQPMTTNRVELSLRFPQD